MYEELVKRLRDISNSDRNIKSNYIGLTMIQAADAIEELSNGSEKVVMDYCRKRNLVLITYESFERLKAYYNRGVMPLPEPPKEET